MKFYNPTLVALLVFFGLVFIFAHATVYAADGSQSNGSVVLTQKEFAKLQQFIEDQQKQLDRATKQAQKMSEAYLAAKNCVIESARQGVATTPCFEECSHFGMDCRPSTVEN